VRLGATMTNWPCGERGRPFTGFSPKPTLLVMSSHGENYYEILGVERTASGEEIRGAYRRLVQRAHPDTGGTGALFRLVRDAYAVLSDPERRRVYDELLTAPPGPVRVEETKEQAGPSAGGDGAGPDGREAAVTPLTPILAQRIRPRFRRTRSGGVARSTRGR
jgi:curved DNA-binding protein CbpA